MFSFFDKHSMEATDLKVLLAQIKELLTKVSYIKFPMVHLAEHDIHCFLYLDFSQSYNKNYQLETELKIDTALENLMQLVWVAHCYEDYLKTFNENIAMFPVDEQKLKALSPDAELDLDLEKALNTLDTSSAVFQDNYQLLQIQIAKYLHHLIFLETNCTLEPHYFSVPSASGEVFSPLVIEALSKQGVFTKSESDKKILQDKIILRHQNIVTDTFRMDYTTYSP